MMFALVSVAVAQAGCPCANVTLCEPIARAGPEKVYAFHVSSPAQTWRHYDWSQVSMKT